ncbi:glutathione S-transferase [Azorhizobium oxalatiphilum]|uniref:Glutathione S-transferase n=1 Tax=Azorhizobium oxalatiphilum TaxID=980631 RepID=A0A917F6F3_9HYPH|nr:glutathione S-transferase family protein [Azorhizobium oxalatiphilum]GGF55590.1 glutathione S-transferase [Azorhizobium oxalatiphilum]
MSFTLIIGNKTYSSWSLRPWLALSAAGVPFQEKLLPLGSDMFRETLAEFGTSGRVPLLLDGEVKVWESLAIIDHVAERHPDRPIWPQDPAARGMARSIAAEMHAGFQALRNELPMNLARPPETRAITSKAAADVSRILSIFVEARRRFGADGPFLFGRFCAADAMFAPVATRLATYMVPLDPISESYVQAILAQPDFVRWREAALKEEWVVAEDEVDWPEVKRF